LESELSGCCRHVYGLFLLAVDRDVRPGNNAHAGDNRIFAALLNAILIIRPGVSWLAARFGMRVPFVPLKAMRLSTKARADELASTKMRSRLLPNAASAFAAGAPTHACG
jgi:type IV secretory pathway TrbD component